KEAMLPGTRRPWALVIGGVLLMSIAFLTGLQGHGCDNRVMDVPSRIVLANAIDTRLSPSTRPTPGRGQAIAPTMPRSALPGSSIALGWGGRPAPLRHLRSYGW
ncbi:MAG TPA: hypothetical protein VF844_05280, partial [Ktedonobacteraceae bacterium]